MLELVDTGIAAEFVVAQTVVADVDMQIVRIVVIADVAVPDHTENWGAAGMVVQNSRTLVKREMIEMIALEKVVPAE